MADDLTIGELAPYARVLAATVRQAVDDLDKRSYHVNPDSTRAWLSWYGAGILRRFGLTDLANAAQWAGAGDEKALAALRRYFHPAPPSNDDEDVSAPVPRVRFPPIPLELLPALPMPTAAPPPPLPSTSNATYTASTLAYPTTHEPAPHASCGSGRAPTCRRRSAMAYALAMSTH